VIDRFVVVVVAGLSGAGRSTALRTLEDLGFHCVDNLPPTAFVPALQACARDNLERVALGIDVRVRSFLDPTLAAIEEVRSDLSRAFTLLFLEATDASLLARYSATRRPHPLSSEAGSGSLALLDGIRLERERLAPLRANASLVLDTSSLNVHQLRRRIVETFRPQAGRRVGMATRIVSFGFKYGTPVDLDLLFDVRFVDNPHFNDVLRPLSGLDPPVRKYVRENPTAAKFAEHVEGLLGFLLPQYEQEGKSYLTIGFGCTGGRHRSVVLAEWAKELCPEGSNPVVSHRDVDRVEAEGADQRELARVLPGAREM
jgi:RNase adapter protein RapZ